MLFSVKKPLNPKPDYKLYSYIVSGGDLREVCARSLPGEKGVGMWCSVLTSCCVANFRPALRFGVYCTIVIKGVLKIV